MGELRHKLSYLLVLLFWGQQALALDSCETALIAGGDYRAQPIEYSCLLNPVAGVKSQGHVPSCTIESAVGLFEQLLLEKTGGNVELSSAFIVARTYRNQALLALRRKKKIFPAGNSAKHILEQIERQGLMPTAAWTPPYPIQNFVNELKSVVDRYRNDPAQLRWRERQKRGIPEINALYKNYMAGAPEEFEFEGVRLSPRQLMDFLLPDGATFHKVSTPGVLSLQGLPRAQDLECKNQQCAATAAQENRKLVWHHDRAQFESPDEAAQSLDQVIIQSLDQGRSPMISVRWLHDFIDKEHGVLSLAVKVDGEFPIPLTEQDRWHYARIKSFHFMRIVGYRLDLDGRIEWLRIRNSHGRHSGIEGEFDMHRSYLKYFLESIVVLDPH